MGHFVLNEGSKRHQGDEPGEADGGWPSPESLARLWGQSRKRGREAVRDTPRWSGTVWRPGDWGCGGEGRTGSQA